MTEDEVLACPDCDRTPVVANAPGGRSHGDSEDYRCTRCGWKGDEPRRRERRGDPDLRPDSLAAKLDDAESLDELVTDGGVDQDAGVVDRIWECPDCGLKIDRHYNKEERPFCDNCEYRHGTLIEMRPKGPGKEKFQEHGGNL